MTTEPRSPESGGDTEPDEGADAFETAGSGDRTANDADASTEGGRSDSADESDSDSASGTSDEPRDDLPHISVDTPD